MANRATLLYPRAVRSAASAAGGLISKVLSGGGGGGDTAVSIYSVDTDQGVANYLTGTFGTPTDVDVWTMSAFISMQGASHGANRRGLYVCGNDGNDGLELAFVGESIRIYRDGTNTGGYNANLNGTSTWHHFLWRTNGTTQELRIDDVQRLSTAHQGTQHMNKSGETLRVAMGLFGDTDSYAYGGFLHEFHFVDGQYLDATDFADYGGTNPVSLGAYSGSYGNNGFRLKFDDSNDFGKDSSGNGNHLTEVGTLVQSTEVPSAS